MAREAVQRHEGATKSEDTPGSQLQIPVAVVNSSFALQSIPREDIDATLRGLIWSGSPEIQHVRSLQAQDVFTTKETLYQGLSAGSYSLLMCNVGLHLSLCTGVAQMTTVGSLIREYLSYPTVRHRHQIGPILQNHLQEILSAQPDEIDVILQTIGDPIRWQIPIIISKVARDLLHTGLSVKQHRFLFACPEITGISNIVALPLEGSLCLSSVGEIFAIVTTRCLERAPYRCNNVVKSGTATNGEGLGAYPPSPTSTSCFGISFELRCKAVEIRIIYFHPNRLESDHLPRHPSPTTLLDPRFAFNRVSAWLSLWSRYQTLPNGQKFSPPDGYSEGNIDILKVFVS
ncbi:hypothetical protein TWF569_005183 [Orbilia oligospora]|uniref:Uncharacterized protein n=1 Tax=Orbilia oligospora TaxID=2813651 RepID=A0A7C8JMY1_ORBOL|nr:hypothetical protein TWF102_001374 [Orbilia oligospora]KAF3113620.1 hypothetical protein TWF103_001975 [Orbilia oligospora]KAF3134379.1 hypothetical protein TWF703_006361 [Orbilia oligospora]KAF3149106.1 hypothetical protein TWF569_005183 [Orbilia oligospora]